MFINNIIYNNIILTNVYIKYISASHFHYHLLFIANKLCVFRNSLFIPLNN